MSPDQPHDDNKDSAVKDFLQSLNWMCYLQSLIWTGHFSAKSYLNVKVKIKLILKN